MRYDRDSIYRLERDSIARFVASVGFYGGVLDYGCGQQPYRGYVEQHGADYHPYDSKDFPGGSGGDIGEPDPLKRAWDMILCTQVIEYVPDPWRLLRAFVDCLDPGGRLVMTGPGCWHEEEPSNLMSYTRNGIGQVLRSVGFKIERFEERAAVELPGFRFSLGWGVVARA